jgi:23S rRNA (uracil1939-C5)-methyltransferase
MRARLHVREGRIGFYREGTHDLCNAADTGQLHAATLPVVQRVVDGLCAEALEPVSVEVAESIASDQRAVEVEVAGSRAADGHALQALLDSEMQSIAVVNARGVRASAGPGVIVETLAAVTRGAVHGELRRQPQSFFQANRFLIADLVSAVAGHVAPDGDVLDLYAGVGLFALAAGSGRRVTAVEGHPGSGADLAINARMAGPHVTAIVSSVEAYLAGIRACPDTVIVDPPRTGLSPDVLAVLKQRPPQRLIYVSCDPATLARDARGLLDGGFGLRTISGFDLFPNTPHVEAVAVFDRSRAATS